MVLQEELVKLSWTGNISNEEVIREGKIKKEKFVTKFKK